jgi:hypothetical protein
MIWIVFCGGIRFDTENPRGKGDVGARQNDRT